MNALQMGSRPAPTNWTAQSVATLVSLVTMAFITIMVQSENSARVMVVVSAFVLVALVTLGVTGDLVRGGAIAVPAAVIVATGFLLGPVSGGLRSLLAGLLVGATVSCLRLLDPAILSGNDSSVAVATAAMAGWFSWMTVAVVFALGVVANGFIAAIVLSRRRDDCTAFAVSPALIAAGLLTLAVV